MAIPFHRRILLWIFITAFVALAPIVVLYTSGYRWNVKKGRIERNGTLIIDSVPNGAAIAIDGRLTGEKTPITLQNIAPGLHRIRVTADGFSPWEKSIDLRPERVTFANAIRLWKQNEPKRTDGASMDEPRLQRSPNGKWILLETATGTRLVRATNEQKPLELPRGFWRWSGENLVGVDSGTLFTCTLSKFQITKTALPHGIVDREDGVELRTTEEGLLALVMPSDPNTGFLLPSGNWNIWSLDRSRMLLRDGTHWLSTRIHDHVMETHEAMGDALRPLRTFREEERFLLVNGGELWQWAPNRDPELLLRQSERIVNAAWHRNGNDVFFATDKIVSALNLDPRDGRLVTRLASFDRMTDLSVLEHVLVITGTRNGIKGLWTLEVE